MESGQKDKPKIRIPLGSLSLSTTYAGSFDIDDKNFVFSASSAGKFGLFGSSGSVTVKIYTINRQAGLYYSVCWSVGPKRHTKNFQNCDRAEALAAA
jgi:hypothetical protein